MNASATMTWLERYQAAALAIVGTALYAASFLLQSAEIVPFAGAISAAAGLAWIAVGVIVLIVDRPRAFAWADVCLRTMNAGMPWLLLAAGINVLSRFGSFSMFLALHIAILVAADATMTRRFLRAAGSARAALGLWVMGLHGSFVLFLAVFWRVPR